MSINIDPKKVHSAISSWSGFVYQGKVALYHSIKLLLNASQTASYSLQLDSLEDFAILNRGHIVSIHQVKALKSNIYTTYKIPFEDLCTKSINYGNVPAFFHTARKIKDKSVSDIELSHAPMKVFMYGTNPNCTLEEIDNLIAEAIFEFHQTYVPIYANANYTLKTQHYLDAVVQSRVIKIHAKIHDSIYSENVAAYVEQIPFQEFLDILYDDTIAKISSSDYFLHLTRLDLNKYFQEFCYELPDETLEDCRKKLNNFATFFNSLNEEDLVKLICKIIPHRNFLMDTIHDYKDNNIQKDEIKQALFKCLKELKEIKSLDIRHLNWTIGLEKYVPTCINWTQDHHQEACAKIIENILRTDLNLPFETASLVTANMNVSSVYNAAADIMDIDEEDLDKEAEKITNWKKMSLTSLEEAKKKII